MPKCLLLVSILSCIIFASPSDITNKKISIIDLECENLINPLSIGSSVPRFSWKLQSYKNGVKQKAYRIIVSGSPEEIKCHKGNYWDSGKIESNQSINVPYNGRELISGLKLYWAVKVWDQNNSESEWNIASFETGLLNNNDWKALWIGTECNIPQDSAITGPAPYFRKEFELNKKIKSVRAYVCGLGFYELYLNGNKIGDQVLAPAQTNYDVRNLNNLRYPYDDQSTQRVLYNTFDVTGQLKSGQNTVGIVLGNGWYNMRDHRPEGDMWYDTPRLILQMEVIYQDGTKNLITSDSSWKYTTGPLLHDGIYTGEMYDARLQLAGWNMNGYDDGNWNNARLVRPPSGALQPQLAPYDKIMRTISPLSVKRVNDSTYLFSIDEMISGWAQLKVKGNAGDTIRLRFIAEEGNDYKQSDTYILSGKGEETWEPKFTWHAFRTIEAVSKKAHLDKNSLLVKVVNTDVKSAGSFYCSNKLFNKIYKNYLRTQFDNFHGSLSSDCPHRERLGYTGDGEVLTETALYSFDMIQFYNKWFNDFEDARNKKTGFVTHTAPFEGGGGGPAWGSAMVIMPWKYYCFYGDRKILEDHYRGMKQWVAYLSTRTDERGIVMREEPNGWCLGDWCTVDKIELPAPLVNTCYYYYVTNIMKDVAGVLGRKGDSLFFANQLNKIKNDFNRVFYDSVKKQYWENRQGANVFPLAFGLVSEENENAVYNSLLDHLKKLNYHFDTGILSTPLLLNVLTQRNNADLAYQLMNQKDYPGFGDAILNKGATCLWEYWDGRKSRCHPMFGSVIAWFYKTLAGINYDTDNPGMQHFIIEPGMYDSLSFCKASYNSVYGKIVSDWKVKKDGTFTINVEIPDNTTATIKIPAKDEKHLLNNNIPVSSSKNIKIQKFIDGKVILDLEPGRYNLSSSN
ncbi:MAG: family 78 glycoside hydrolase catalytic domain [Ignavibacteriaceae bacterium]|nr:family 78 glycoside hydrolase catalytic domain [Ignavibacteriaceae bacterium]